MSLSESALAASNARVEAVIKKDLKKSVGGEPSFAFLLPVLQRLWCWLVHGAKARFGSSLYFLAEKRMRHVLKIPKLQDGKSSSDLGKEFIIRT